MNYWNKKSKIADELWRKAKVYKIILKNSLQAKIHMVKLPINKIKYYC